MQRLFEKELQSEGFSAMQFMREYEKQINSSTTTQSLRRIWTDLQEASTKSFFKEDWRKKWGFERELTCLKKGEMLKPICDWIILIFQTPFWGSQFKQEQLSEQTEEGKWINLQSEWTVLYYAKMGDLLFRQQIRTSAIPRFSIEWATCSLLKVKATSILFNVIFDLWFGQTLDWTSLN